jgi:hypothetical protein
MSTRPDQGPAACDVAGSGTIELAFYGELSAPDRAAFERHVASCGQCRQAFEEMSIIRDALAGRPDVAAPPGGEWSGFMSRLERAIETDAARDAGSAMPDPIAPLSLPSRIPDPASRHRSYAVPVAMAALLALVTINVVFVARSRSASPPAAATAERAPASAAEDVAFEALSEEHFERSKLVVLGLATKDAEHVNAADWTYERQLAASLLVDTRMYRLAAEDRGLRSLAGVMRDLELVLLQTSLTDETDPSSLPQIQRLIGKRDLLQKMESVGTGL